MMLGKTSETKKGMVIALLLIDHECQLRFFSQLQSVFR